jgi:mono/diheme cytochrome c family protein
MTVMPPMLGILTKPQIRDVVAYLAALKGKTSPKKRGSWQA